MDNPEKQGTQHDDIENKNRTQYDGHHYAQRNTNNVNKTRVLLQYWRQRRTEHRCYAEIATDITIRNSELKDT